MLRIFYCFVATKVAYAGGADAPTFKVKTIRIKESPPVGQGCSAGVLLKEIIEVVWILKSKAVGNVRNT